MARECSPDDGAFRSDGFPSTRWSLVARAGQQPGAQGGGPAPADGGGGDTREALGHLLTLYLPALRAHLVSRRISAQNVDDLLQGFVAEKVIERNFLAVADPARGQFRAFLATALDNFAKNQFRHDGAHKRAPSNGKVLAWDAQAGLDPAVPGVEAADPFDIVWARQALSEAVRRTREKCLADGRADLWGVLEVRVLAPALDGAEPLPYGEMVRRFGYATPKQAANALVTAKRRLELELRATLAEYLTNEDELEQELASLGHILKIAPHASLEDAGHFGAALRAAARGGPESGAGNGGAEPGPAPGTGG